MAPRRTEEKMGRGQISCAECRRLKIRCDKQIPCGSCIRRGCDAICPTGNLLGGQGTRRFILADTEHLHQKISKMSHRIRHLEDALEILQSTLTDEEHPLLSKEHLAIKFEGEAVIRNADDTEEPDVVEAMGTLSISESGASHYYGPSAGSEFLLVASDPKPQSLYSTPSEGSSIPRELLELSAHSPFCWDHDPLFNPMERLQYNLPPYPRAWSLFETYTEHVSYYFRPLKREAIIEDLLKPFYKSASDNSRRNPHNLAVLYFLFANAALFDLTLPPYNEEAENYYRLGRAALSLKCIFSEVDVPTVEAVSLMALYHNMSGPRNSLGSAWNLFSLASKLGQSIGLHRDGTRWNLPPKAIQEQRNLFWEIAIQDIIASLALGRPPSISLSDIDCKFPMDEEANPDGDSEDTKRGFWNWKFWYSRRLFWTLANSASSAKGLSYNEILNLDRDIRQMKLPTGHDKPPAADNVMQHMQYCMVRQCHAVALLYLHRKHFAESLLKFPHNPLCSKYAHSTLVAYRQASATIHFSVEEYQHFPRLLNRHWGFWTQVFGSAIIVGSIVTRSPTSSMAENSFKELCLALELLEKGAVESPRAKVAMGIIKKLKENSIEALASTKIVDTTPVNGQDNISAGDELATFAGRSALNFRVTGPPTTLPADTSPMYSSWALENLGIDITSEILVSTHGDLSPPVGLTEEYHQFNSNAVPFLSLGDVSEFAMGDCGNVVQNDQWTQILTEFGLSF